MSWLRIDDGFASHPKLAGLTDRQHRVWIRTLCYCAKYESAELSDGRLSEIPGFDGGIDGALMRAFLKARLVDYVGGIYLVHDWDDYQPKDKTGAERQARFRKRRNAGVTVGVTENVTPPSRPVTTTPTHPPELQDVGGRVAEENGGENTDLERIQALEELRAMREAMTT